MKSPIHPSVEEISLVEVLRAIGDPVRVGIVKALARCGELERACGTLTVPVCKSTMSHHVRVLRECGLVRVRQDSTRSMLSLRRDDLESRFPGLLESILVHTEGVGITCDQPHVE